MTSACLGGLELFLAITSQLKNSDLQHCIWIDTEIDIDIEINTEIDIERHIEIDIEIGDTYRDRS